jgi:NAD(P)-dependent dehydrogenase (short-subunit alcohol dehydrogenase family)
VSERQDLGDLDGRSALVTGAGDVGGAIALALARHNAGMVAIVDLDRERAEDVARQVEAIGVAAMPIVANLTDPDAARSMAEQVASQGKEIDILVNNAGLPPNYFTPERRMKPFLESDPKEWNPLLELNLEAVLRMSHAFVGPMVERGFGRVISIVSDAARAGDRYMAVYAAAKGGTSAFMRTLATEVGPHGVTVNCVSLGTVWRFEEPPSDKDLRFAARNYPTACYGTVDDVTSMVTFLASGAAGWITGQVYGVNGGYTYGL